MSWLQPLPSTHLLDDWISISWPHISSSLKFELMSASNLYITIFEASHLSLNYQDVWNVSMYVSFHANTDHSRTLFLGLMISYSLESVSPMKQALSPCDSSRVIMYLAMCLMMSVSSPGFKDIGRAHCKSHVCSLAKDQWWNIGSLWFWTHINKIVKSSCCVGEAPSLPSCTFQVWEWTVFIEQWDAIIHQVFVLAAVMLCHCQEMRKHTKHFRAPSLAIILIKYKNYEFLYQGIRLSKLPRAYFQGKEQFHIYD